MNGFDSLIGGKFPVKTNTGEIIGYRLITRVQHLENVAALVLGLNGREPTYFMGYMDASKLEEEQKNLNDLNWIKP